MTDGVRYVSRRVSTALGRVLWAVVRVRSGEHRGVFPPVMCCARVEALPRTTYMCVRDYPPL